MRVKLRTRKISTNDLIKEALDFVDNNRNISWKPKDFPEDMTEESTFDELVSDGNAMYSLLEKAIPLINELQEELDIFFIQKTEQ